MGTGKTAATSHLRGIESEVAQSGQRMTQSLSAETRRQQKITDDHLAYSIQSAKQRTAIADKANQDTINQMLGEQKARNQFFNQQKRIDQESVEYAAKSAQMRTQTRQAEVAAINNQTKAQAAQNAQIRAYAQEQQRTGMGKIGQVIDSQKVKDADRDLKNLTKTTQDGTKATGMWGQAFKGAFIGAIAGMVFSTIIGGISGITREVVHLGVESVKMAAQFEMTTNAMTLFTGSTRLAKIELNALDELARKTPGLQLNDAQVGAARLRALGFEADIAKNLIAGIAKQKLISGVTDETAIQRVLVNLQQLKAGSPQIQKDIQQMVLSIPSLSLEIEKAFGGIEKFKQALRKDPDAALDKFAKDLADAEVPVTGLLNAWEKLEDEFVRAGRTFGEPILEPLGVAFGDLEGYLHQNMDTWAAWGQSTSDWIFGALDALKEWNEEQQKGFGIQAKGITYNGTTYTEWAENQRKQRQQRNDAPSTGFSLKPKGVTYNNTTFAEWASSGRWGTGWWSKPTDKDIEDNRSFTERGKALRDARVAAKPKLSYADMKREDDATFSKESKVAWANMLRDEARQKERARRQELEQIKLHSDAVLDVIQNRYAVEEAMTERTTKQIGELRNRQLIEEYKAQAAYFAKVLSLEEPNSVEYQKAQIERNKVLGKLQTEMHVNELETQRKVQKERLAAQKEFNDLQTRQAQQNSDVLIFEIERAMETGAIATQKGFDKMRDVTQTAFEQQMKLLKANYDIDIQDKTLTDEQKVNLERKYWLDVQQMTLENRKNIQDIEKQKRADFVEDLRFRREEISSYLQDISSLTASFQDNFFNPQKFSSTSFGAFQNTVLRRPETANLQAQIEQSRKKSSEILGLWFDYKTKVDESPGEVMTEKQAAGFEEFRQAWLDATKVTQGFLKQLDDVEKAIPPVYFKFEELADQIGTDNVHAFDELNKKILESRQRLDLADASGEVEYYNDLLKGVDRWIEGEHIVIKAEKDAGKVREYNLKLEQSQRRLQRIIYDQAAESADQYSQSIKGLDDAFEKLISRDPKKIGALTDLFEKGRREERNTLAANIEFLQMEIASNDRTIDQLEIKQAHLQDILNIRNRETEAIIASNRAELELAHSMDISLNQIRSKVLEHLSQQTTMNDAIADGIIGVYDAAAGELDKLIDKATAKLGILGSLFAEPAKAIGRHFLTEATRGIMDSLMPGLFDKMEATKDPKLAESKKQTQILSRIEWNTRYGGMSGGGQMGGSSQSVLGNIFGGGGGMGIGGTPNWNPNMFSGGGGGRYSGFAMSDAQLQQMTQNASNMPGLSFGGGSGSGFNLSSGINLAASAAMMIGGQMGGIAGSAIQYGGMGAMIGMQIGGPIGAAIGAAGGVLFGLIAGIFGKSARRRKEEKLREKAMGDAFRQMDDLISKVNSDAIEGSQALEQADQIRANYVDSMSQLKDKKTRDHALKDVSRIDAKIEQLKTAVAGQTSRRQRMELFAPTFADGGSVSRFIGDNYRNNPLGYQKGGQKLGYFPKAGTYAVYNERGSEYIFDAETTRNVGVDKLDLIRATKGQVLNSMLFNRSDLAHRANGGSVAVMPTQTQIANQGVAQQPMQLTVSIDGTGIGAVIAEAISIVIRDNNGSLQQINALNTSLENQGQTKLAQTLAEQVKAILGL